MVKKLNKDTASRLAYGDSIVCRKKVVYFGEVCFKKGGVYRVIHASDDRLIVEDELGERFNVNGIIDYTKHFYRVSKHQNDVEQGDYLVNIKKLKGKFKDRFKNGKVYKVTDIDSSGSPTVITETGSKFSIAGRKDFTGHFVKVY